MGFIGTTMFLKFFGVVCLFGLLTACTSTKVHINHRYLSDETVQKMTALLEEAGYQVATNDFAYPNDIYQSTLVYSPMIGDKQAVTNIIDLMALHGWHIPSVNPLVSGKHWFTRDSVGLYLLPDGVNPHNRSSRQDLANQYQTRDCDASASITLAKDGKFTIAVEPAPDDKRSLKGTWDIRNYPVVQLTPDDDLWPWYFEISQHTERDKISAINITELVPLDSYKMFRDCKFVAGERA